MALIRWEPATELSSLQTEMNRLLNSFFDEPTRGGVRDGARRWAPATDLVETDDHFVLRLDLPGVDEDNVNIELENNVLTISGERKAEHEAGGEGQGYHRVERAYGAFQRALTLPEGIDPDAIEANFDRGVLEVRVPKPEQRKPRRVAINVGDAKGAIEGTSSEQS